MTQIQKIEQEVSSLLPQELAEFRAWFEKFDAEIWDMQLEQDVKAGKVDALANTAMSDFKNGKYKKI